ncbi:hypothetical protein RB195_015828 [Necator americanus]|uniref:Uncharacterized protein n=1 Tax=Necator americanus TaxID=51031 RepID=A0ABR1E6C5_NECAM
MRLRWKRRGEASNLDQSGLIANPPPVGVSNDPISIDATGSTAQLRAEPPTQLHSASVRFEPTAQEYSAAHRT